MIPRKKRRMILIGIILSILLILAIAFIIIYMNTDMFKSNQTLFTKYMGKNIENVSNVYQEIEEKSEYDASLEQSKYTKKTNVKMEYTPNKENVINQLNLEINGQVDKIKQYNYQAINLLKNDEKIAELEYIQDEDVQGFCFPDLFKQYLLVDKENVPQLLEKIGITEEVQNLENLELDSIKEVFEFSAEEKQAIKNKYTTIINSNVSKDNFTRGSNQTIQINGKNINVNSYTLTLTKEQMNNIYLKILEEIKQDEIFLNKLTNLQDQLGTYQVEQNSSLKDQFVEKVEKTISNITKNNIGQEEAKITVYENYHKTVRMEMQNPEYKITLDSLSLVEENYMQLAYQEEDRETQITYKRENQKKTIRFQKTEGEETVSCSLSSMQKVNGEKANKNIVATYEDNANKVEATIDQETNKVNEFEDKLDLEKKKKIELSELEEEKLQSVLQQVTTKVSDRWQEITANDIKQEDLLEVLKVVGIKQESEKIENNRRNYTNGEKPF